MQQCAQAKYLFEKDIGGVLLYIRGIPRSLTSSIERAFNSFGTVRGLKNLEKYLGYDVMFYENLNMGEKRGVFCFCCGGTFQLSFRKEDYCYRFTGMRCLWH